MEYLPSYRDDLYLAHHGVKGMKWGVRKDRAAKLNRVDRRYDKLAKKDAKEFARAKMFYGEGAGNRRKLIKNTIAQRKKDNAHYAKVFDTYLAQQDMAKHASAAKKERAVKTAASKTAKTSRGLINAATGNIGRASAAAATLYTIGRYTGINDRIADKIRNNTGLGR